MLCREISSTRLVVLLTSSLVFASAALATNGMNNEGYGPIATAMGGASQAFDNGTAAVMNNPATLTSMEDGTSKLDIAFGLLQPTVSSSMTGMPDADSVADLFIMPAFGYARRVGNWVYGAGVFAQGGMGTDFENQTFLSAGSGRNSMSQVGVGRFSVPVGYRVNEKLGLAMTLDYVWANMDIEMAMGGAQFADFVPNLGGTQQFGSATGSMVDGLSNMIMAGGLNPLGPVNWTHFNFRDDSDFTGQATGSGLAIKLGGIYDVNEDFSLGFSYHGETSLSDLEADEATLGMSANFDDAILAQQWNGIPVGAEGNFGAPAGTYTTMEMDISGKISVKDFQWPSQIGFGMSWKPADNWMVAMDLKQIGWSSVMEDFKMTFTADGTQANPMAAGFAGAEMDLTLKQEWDDQLIIALGAAYQMNENWTFRFGLNQASNPVPDKYLNPLFPAIVESHYTLGTGYKIKANQYLNGSMQIVNEKVCTADSGVSSTHSQLNFQLMYTIGF